MNWNSSVNLFDQYDWPSVLIAIQNNLPVIGGIIYFQYTIAGFFSNYGLLTLSHSIISHYLLNEQRILTLHTSLTVLIETKIIQHLKRNIDKIQSPTRILEFV